MKYLSPQQLSQYERDGYLVVDGFLTPAEVATVKAGIDRVAAEQGRLDKDHGGFNLEKLNDESMNPAATAKRPGMLRKIQGAVFVVPEVRDVFCGTKMLDCMEDLMGPNIYYHSSKVMFKPANGGAPKPWHQDAAYWQKLAPTQSTVWIAIDDADQDNGCVWAIPGSHKLGLIPHVAAELQVEESRIDLKKAAPVPVKSGGLLIFHSLVLHMSHRNASNRSRCAIICDYDGEAIAGIDQHDNRVPGMLQDGTWPLRVERAKQRA
jgi:phytanoyl-CoA hydroxylase